ncbi:MAG: cupin domain-containing protein [Sphingomicrobium sp.]
MKPVERLCSDLDSALAELTSQGFRIETIYPADEPHSATLSRGSETVRLSTRPDAPRPASALPEFRPEFVLSRGGDSGSGRAGMRYRDLIPGRLGGRYIASAITIDEGGPVADWVHYHRLAFQMIFVRRGWVRVVYEDQGAPFVMTPGDLVLQPPGIRHRVLESSPGLEVVELSCPALHETCADHELELPTAVATDRSFGGQRFVRHVAAEAPWAPFAGGEAQDSGISEATGGLAEVRTLRPGGSARLEFDAHPGELVFGFVVDGRARLERGDGFDLAESAAFVIPPGEPWRLADLSADFRLLHVTTARIGENGLAAGN